MLHGSRWRAPTYLHRIAPIPRSPPPTTFPPLLVVFVPHRSSAPGLRPAPPVLRVGADRLHLAGRPVPESGGTPCRRRRVYR